MKILFFRQFKTKTLPKSHSYENKLLLIRDIFSSFGATGRVQVVRGLRAEVGSIKQVTLRKSHNVKNNSKNKALTLSAQSGTTVPNFFVFLLNFACMPHC